MMSRRPKRPSSARRNIKHETFSSFASCARLRNIQTLLTSPDISTETQPRPDAVLCVCGIDSRYNEGTSQLLNYLLFGFFQSRRMELESSGYADEVIDDLILLICPNEVHLYCNPVNYLYLLPYVAHWRNLHIYCLKEIQYEDDEEAEEFKIRSFIEMVEGCKNIGIPYNRTGMKETFDKFAVEKWPIVQAFALEGFGGGGFFTMKYNVIDISSDLDSIYSLVDPVCLEQTVTEELALFEGQWNNFLAAVHVDGPMKMTKLTEGKVSEPLLSYYNHGRVSVQRISQRPSQRHPYVLFGTRSSKVNILTCDTRGQQGSSDVNAVDSSLDNNDVTTHMVCQCVSPKGPLCCARTYFLGNASQPYPVSDEMRKLLSSVDKDRAVLSSVYTVMVTAVTQAIDVYTQSLSINEVKRTVTDYLSQELSKLNVKSPHEITIEAYDNLGSIVDLEEGQYLAHIKTARVAVYDIPSMQHTGSSLGSLVFAESFLDSVINFVSKDGSRSEDRRYFVLTKHIPKYFNWTAGRRDLQLNSNLEKFLHNSSEDFGRDLICGEVVQLVSANQQLKEAREGKLWVYDKCIIFMSSTEGPIVIPCDLIKTTQFYDGDSPSIMAFLLLTCDPSLQSYLPVSYRYQSNQIAVAFTPKSKAYREMFSNVMSAWKEENGRKLEMLENVPSIWIHMHNQLQSKFNLNNVGGSSSMSTLKKCDMDLPGLLRFVDHLAVSSVGQAPLPSKDISLVINEPHDAGGFSDTSQLLVTIISGIPGSYKENLCSVIKNVSKESSRWVILKRTADNVEPFDAVNLQQGLQAVYNKNQKESRRDPRPNRVIVVTPGFTDIIDVVRAIENHPNPSVARNLKIGAVTACIDPLNMFTKNRLTFPKLLNYCAQGWVSNIIFTGSITPKNAELQEAQQLIRCINPDVALMLANKAEVTRSPDLELIMSDSLFTENRMVRARHLLTPGWMLERQSSSSRKCKMDEVCLKFAQPLEKGKFNTRLRGLQPSTLHNANTLSGKVFLVHGRLRFTDSSTLMDMSHIVLSNNTSIIASDNQLTPPTHTASDIGHQYFVIFVGYNLETEKLKDWLRACVKAKPVKKELIRKEGLSRIVLKNIHEKHHLEPLPEGWFYNGSHFVSMSGDKSDSHPNMSDFVEKYLADENLKITKYNTSIDAHVFHDLFEK